MKRTPKMIILTGPIHCGKTTLLESLVASLRSKGLKPAGFLARGLWSEDRRSGFDLIDLGQGTITPLARRRAQAEGPTPFQFFEPGLQAGARALAPEICAGADLVIVDEVGPLELAGQGWAPFLDPFLQLEGPVHLWVVRSGLVESVCRKWRLDQGLVIPADQPQALERLEAAVVKKLRNDV